MTAVFCGPTDVTADVRAAGGITEMRLDIADAAGACRMVGTFTGVRSAGRGRQARRPRVHDGVQWIRAETATGTVKKIVTALGEGAVGIQVGNTEDWMHDSAPAMRHVQVNFIGAAAMMGLVDVTHAGGYATCDVRSAGTPRPAYRNLALVAEKLGDGRFDAIENVADPGVRGYRFVRTGVPLWVVWHEDGVLQLPPATEPAVAVSLRVDVPRVRVTHVTVDDRAFAIETVTASGGVISLSLTSAPVFVEPSP